jgi:hypothetical protein
MSGANVETKSLYKGDDGLEGKKGVAGTADDDEADALSLDANFEAAFDGLDSSAPLELMQG